MNNKTVLITGAAKRLGAVIARELHTRNMNIVIHYNHSEKEALELADQLNGQRANSAYPIRADLLHGDEVVALIDEAVNFKQRIDVLINNASAFYPIPLSEVSTAQWDDMFAVNLKAPFFLAQSLIPKLKEQKGCIINITDIHGEKPLKDHGVYSTTKAGLVMLTRAMAKELAPEVRVNAVAPGAILWPEDMDDGTRDKILRKIPLGRSGDLSDIAKAVGYLINDADYVTGQVLTVDGGRSLNL